LRIHTIQQEKMAKAAKTQPSEKTQPSDDDIQSAVTFGMSFIHIETAVIVLKILIKKKMQNSLKS